MNLYVTRLADGLSASGVRTDVFTRMTDQDVPVVIERSSGARIIHLRAGPARTIPKRVLPLHIPSMVTALQSFVARERVQYDVWHSHYWLSGLIAMRVRHDPCVPVVHMFHTLGKVKQEYLGEADHNDSPLREDGERCLISSADVVVGATATENDLMQRLYGRSPSWFEVIPPGVDLTSFRPRDRRESRARLGLGDEPIILFVGRLDKIKGLDLLLQSMVHLKSRLSKPVTLVVLGGFESDTERIPLEYRERIRALGIDERVQFRGMIAHHELPHYYSAADVCVMPSAYESYGMVAIESMACQTPLVAFAVGGLAQSIRHGDTGFLAQAGNGPAFETALLHALSHPDLAGVGRRARLSVQHLDWTAVVEKTLSVYERSCEARSRVGSVAASGC